MLNNYHHIPFELASLQQWVCWIYEDRDGKPTKVPKSPHTGLNAGVTDPRSWGWFPDALNATEDGRKCGLGFVFTETDPYVGIDIDNCICPDGSYTDEGTQALAAFGGSYHEVSPSGNGLKFWIKATLPTEKTGRKNSKLKVEAYRCKRFFTVTGNTLIDQPKPILDCNEALQIWYAQKFPPDTDSDSCEFDEIECAVSAEEIIAKAKAGDPTFAKLFAGDWSGYPSQSEADLALCSRVARLTGPDPNRIDEVLRESELYREKWERNDYRTKTIKMAIAYAARTYHDPMKDFASLADQLRNPTFQQGSTAMTIPVLSSFVGSVNMSSPEWPEPLPLTMTVAQEMTADDFYPSLADMIRAVAEQTETPIELPGLMALGVMATACQGKFRVFLPDGHSEPLNLWVCPAMGPGNRKTAVVTSLVKPLHDWEYDRRNQLKPEIEQNNSLRKSMEKQIESLRASAAKKEDIALKQKILLQIRQSEQELPAVRYAPVLMTDDCTPENVAIMLSRHDEKLSFISDEGGLFDMMAGRYARGVPNLEVYLQSHAGSSVRVHRSNRDDIELRNPCLTIALSVQPEHLRQFAANPAFSGRGLLDRFLFAIPNSKLGWRKLEPRPLPVEVSTEWNRLIRSTLDLHQQRNQWGDLLPHALQLNPAAYHLWKQEQAANEIDMRPGNSWESAPGWASKYPGAVLRIAAIMHIATTVSVGVQPEDCTINDTGMANAILLGRKIKQHSLRAFGLMQMDANQQLAVRVSEWIPRQGLMLFTSRDVARALNGARSNHGVDEALVVLTDSGWIRPILPVPGPGRPKKEFEVNPRVYNNR